MRISDWSSDVCSSDLVALLPETVPEELRAIGPEDLPSELRGLLPSELPSDLEGIIPEDLATLIPEEWRSLIPEEYQDLFESPSASPRVSAERVEPDHPCAECPGSPDHPSRARDTHIGL